MFRLSPGVDPLYDRTQGADPLWSLKEKEKAPEPELEEETEHVMTEEEGVMRTKLQNKLLAASYTAHGPDVEVHSPDIHDLALCQILMLLLRFVLVVIPCCYLGYVPKNGQRRKW